MFQNLINLYSDRITPETVKEWNNLAERNVRIPEMSKIGISLTDHAIKRQCKLFKESPPISNEQTTKSSKKFKNEHLAFDIFENENTPISDEDADIWEKYTNI